MSLCPYCQREWVRSTSPTTGCCDGERLNSGHLRLPDPPNPPAGKITHVGNAVVDGRPMFAIILDDKHANFVRVDPAPSEDPLNYHEALLGLLIPWHRECMKRAYCMATGADSTHGLDSCDAFKEWREKAEGSA